MTGTQSRPPKAALLIAQRIVRDVITAGLKPGDLLLPERTMLEKYQTGRGTLREALRLLEFQGVITLKPGPRGGRSCRTPTRPSWRAPWCCSCSSRRHRSAASSRSGRPWSR